ncbi:MAG TPA: glutathione ABC transporter permease GsiC, partial [bacterium]|nr:glutathione ABC transporter permease GsiC [bacterium]
MWRYLVRRLIAAMVVVVGVSFVVFLVLHLTPGDPAQVLLGPRATPDDLARLRQELGLDRPVLIQYLRWASHV